MNKLRVLEYRRKVFNTSLLECLSRIHLECAGIDCKCEEQETKLVANKAKQMCDAFYKEQLKLDTSTIAQTKANLSEAVTFIQDCLNICETIADEKADVAEREELDIDEDEPIELSDEDEALIDQVFDEKDPDVQVDAIRDATVKALIAEDEKAKEVRDSISIAQSQVAAGEDPEALEETIQRLDRRGPTSLMNAILNYTSVSAVRFVNEHTGKAVGVGQVMSENADEIKTNASLLYMLYEMANVFGIAHWTAADIRHEAERIYHEK